MKSITFASGTIVTGNAVAEALVNHMSGLSGSDVSTSVEIPVLEKDGSVATHTIVLGAAAQFDVADADVDGADADGHSADGDPADDDPANGGPADDEETRFPVPVMPDTNMVAVVPSADDGGGDEGADNFNRAMADLDSVLDDPSPL